jgi:hypothetical protein
MATQALRSSTRLQLESSNGRAYLADLIGWMTAELESWIRSSTVQPHLQLWYHLCVASARRFNDAVEWINSGPEGYYYHPRDLEEDLLLMCLCEGVASNGTISSVSTAASYENKTAATGKWITQELWARVCASALCSEVLPC